MVSLTIGLLCSNRFGVGQSGLVYLLISLSCSPLESTSDDGPAYSFSLLGQLLLIFRAVVRNKVDVDPELAQRLAQTLGRRAVVSPVLFRSGPSPSCVSPVTRAMADACNLE